jgi:hypothetical protein
MNSRFCWSVGTMKCLGQRVTHVVALQIGEKAHGQPASPSAFQLRWFPPKDRKFYPVGRVRLTRNQSILSMIRHSRRRCDGNAVFAVECSMVTAHFVHAGIDKSRNSGAGSDTETSDGSKHCTQAISGTGW